MNKSWFKVLAYVPSDGICGDAEHDEAYQWCKQNIDKSEWHYEGKRIFWFKSRQNALLFKLRFGTNTQKISDDMVNNV